jgi:hypothetical protein
MRTRLRLAWTALLALCCFHPAILGASRLYFPDDCAEVCTSETTCTDSCYPDEISFINGNAISCLQWGTYAWPCCGDTACNGGETASSCFDDCHCGDGTCNGGENSTTCPSDCSGGGGCSGGTCAVCPNGTCEQGETCLNCPQDCGTCYCGDYNCNTGGECGGAGWSYSPCAENDQRTYCPTDCGQCDESYCLYVEDGKVCSGDSGRCGPCDAWTNQCPTGWTCVTGFPGSHCEPISGAH